MSGPFLVRHADREGRLLESGDHAELSAQPIVIVCRRPGQGRSVGHPLAHHNFNEHRQAPSNREIGRDPTEAKCVPEREPGEFEGIGLVPKGRRGVSAGCCHHVGPYLAE